MSERRKALMRKFQASSADRLRRMGLALIELSEMRGGESDVREIARELHTLKGESNMLGLPRVAKVTHAAETLLGAGGSLPSAPTCALIQRALDLVDLAIQERLDAPEESLDAMVVTLGIGAEVASSNPSKVSSGPPYHGSSSSPMLPGKPSSSGPPGSSKPPLREGSPAPGMSSPPLSANGTPLPTPDIPPAPVPPRGRAGTAERWVQIEAGRVDALCESVTGFAADFRALSARVAPLLGATKGAGATRTSITAGLRILAEEFDRVGARLDDVTDAAWALRLSPIEPVLQELVRHARGLAFKQNKRVRVSVHAGGAAVERTLLDELWEPLLHLVQNAVDHGIETPENRGDKPPEAQLRLHAEAVGPNVVITVGDDGRGIDAERVREAARARGLVGEAEEHALTDRQIVDLIFVHGLSTRDSVTDVSGRGVGLDVVRGKIEAFGGSVSVTSERGLGTRFALTLPSTVSRERTLVIELSGTLYGIASRSIMEILRVADHSEEVSAEGRILVVRDEPLPLRSLAGTLGVPRGDFEPWALVLESGGRRYAFTIPKVVGEHDLLRRSIDPLLASVGYLGASSTLDDGRLVLLVLVAGLVRRPERAVPLIPAATVRRKRRVLVVDDAMVVRDMLTDLLSDAGIDVQTAEDGRAALAILEGVEPDLVLSDVDMPGMNGFELLKKIRARSPKLPVIMLTARSGEADKRVAKDAGAAAYIVKSASQAGVLVETVGRFLGARV